MEINNGLAGGGITGAIIASLYIGYKCCYRKKFHSKCCGAEMDVETDAKAQEETTIEMAQAAPVSRQATPVITAAKAPVAEPPILNI